MSYPGIGYNCAVCGQWVASGMVHSCGGYPYAPGSDVKWDRMSDVRIANALERIAAVLERLGGVSFQDTRPK